MLKAASQRGLRLVERHQLYNGDVAQPYVICDFNGDGRDDAAAICLDSIGYGEAHVRVLTLFSSDSGYSAVLSHSLCARQKWADPESNLVEMELSVDPPEARRDTVDTPCEWTWKPGSPEDHARLTYCFTVSSSHCVDIVFLDGGVFRYLCFWRN